MKKMKPSVKAVLAPTLVLASTAAIAYAFPDAASEKATDNQTNLKLDVERIDSDTVKVSIDNIQDIPRSLQFSIKLDGVTLQNGQNSIRDLVEKEVTARQEQNNSINQVLTDYTYNETDNTIDVLITSTESLPKVGNKIEVFELDVKKSTDDEINTYKVIPTENSEYKYVTNTSKEYSTTNADHENAEILLAAKPTIKVGDRYTSVIDGETLTVEQLQDALGLELAHEDGEDNLVLEIIRDGKVIENFSELTPGVYKLSLCAVKDGTLKSDAITVEVVVTLDPNVTDAPTIKKDNIELVEQITLEAGEAFSPTENVTATDAKGRDVEVSVKADRDLDLDPDKDTDYTLTYTATDIYGNKAEKVVILTVIANQAPTIEGVTDITIKVGDKFDPKAGIKVSDDKDENPTLTIDGEVNTKLPGKYKLSYTVTDSRGKSIVVHRTVTVQQKTSSMNIAPFITADNMTITVGDEFNPLLNVTAYDHEDKDLTKSVRVAINEVDRFTPGTYKLVYQVTDSAGATAKKEVTVTVLPKVSVINAIPQIKAEDKIITVGMEFNPLEGVTAEDKEDGNLTSEIKVVDNEVNIYRVGKYYVTYQVTDKNGATATKRIAVSVNPKLSLINAIPQIKAENQTIMVGDKFNPLANVTAYDAEDLDLTHKVKVIENNVDTTKPGQYIVKYSVTDSAGATAKKEVTVTVLSKVSVINAIPQIKAENQTIKVGDKFNPLANVTAYDAEDLDLTHKVKVIENNVDTTKPGQYTVKYSVTDSAGATAKKEVTVTVLMKLVVMNTAPEIRATDLVIKTGSTFNAKENVVAYDKEDLDISHKLEVIENTVNTKVAGEYKVTYRVIDSAGATTTKTIKVTVKKELNLATSITINNKEDNKIYVNGHKTITANVDKEADIKEINWTISDSSIAELRIVRNEARIIAKKAGEVTLTAKTTDGSKITDTITIIVSEFANDKTVPTFVKDIVDTTVLTPVSGLGNQDSPLEIEVKDVQGNELDGFLTNLSKLNYQLISVNEDEEYKVYNLRVLNSKLEKATKEEIYMDIKVSKSLANVDEINAKLEKLGETEKPETGTTNNPSTGHTTVLGYVGLVVTAVGGFLFSKKNKTRR